MVDPDLAAKLESRLRAAGMDGLSDNFRCVLPLGTPPAFPPSVARDLERALARRPQDARLLALSGKIHLGAGRNAPARLALDRAVALGEPRARVWRAQLLLAEERFAEALAELEPVRGAPWSAFYRGAALVGLGRVAQAEQSLREAHGPADARDAARCLRALLEIRNGRGARARELLRPVLARRRTEGGPHLLSALAWRAMGRADRARRDMDTARSLGADAPWAGNAERPEPRLSRAVELIRRGRHAEGQAELRAALDECSWPTPRDGAARAALLRIAAAAGDFARVVAWGEEVLSGRPSAAEMEALRVPFMTGDYADPRAGDEHVRRLRAALARLDARRPGTPLVRFYRLLLDARHRPRQREKLRRLVRGLPARRYGWMRLESLTSGFIEDEPEAWVREHREAARAFAPNWRDLCKLGEMLACLGRPGPALAAFAQAERVAPTETRAETAAWKGEVLLWLGRYAEAERALRKALGRARYADGWLGGALLKRGRARAALEALDRALLKLPGDTEARVWRAEALRRLDRGVDALRDAETALAADPHNPYALALRGLLRASAGEPGAAEAALDSLPSEVADFVRTRAKGPRAVDALEAVLDLSRGVRRSGTENWVWLRSETAP